MFAVELEKLLVNDRTTTLSQTNKSPKQHVKPYQTLQTTKVNFKKLLCLTSFQQPQYHNLF